MSNETNTGTGDDPSTKKDCDWKGCKKNHLIPNTYGNRSKGEIKPARIFGYHPSMYGKFGKQLGNMSVPFRSKSMGSSRRWDYNYRYQVHHVIPCNLVESFPELFNNLMLLGWDFNNFDNNGLSLPMYDADIVWHDLQPHFTNHSKYDSRVEEFLRRLEKDCVNYCDNSESENKDLKTQESLLFDIEKIINHLREKIVNWSGKYILMQGLEYKGKKRESRMEVFEKRSDDGIVPLYPARKW